MSCTSWAAFEPSSGSANSAAVEDSPYGALVLDHASRRFGADHTDSFDVMGAQVAAFINTDAAALPVWTAGLPAGRACARRRRSGLGQRVQAPFELGAFNRIGAE